MEFDEIKLPDGHIRNLKIYIKPKAKNIIFETEPATNSIILRVIDLQGFVRSNDFYYKLVFFPVTACMDIDLGSINMMVKMRIRD